jgi:hypothetical protein
VIRDIVVISRKNKRANTMGLTTFPSSSPNPYQSRLSGLSTWGATSVTSEKRTLKKSADAANSIQATQYAYIAKTAKTTAKNHPNF